MIKLVKREHDGVIIEDSVDARDLHGRLEVKSKFANWISRKIEKYKFIEGVHYLGVSQKWESPQTGALTATKEYYLTLDTAKHLAMLQNNKIGFKIRDYFIKVEQEHKNRLATTNIDIDALAHKISGKLLEDNKSLKNEMEELKEQIESIRSFVGDNSLTTFTHFARSMDITVHQLIDCLRRAKYISHIDNSPLIKATSKNYIVSVYNGMYGGKIRYQTYLTKNGVNYFLSKKKEILDFVNRRAKL